MNGLSRRSALTSAALATIALVGCGGSAPPAAAPAPAVSFKLEPLADLVAAAGLEWLVVLSPKTLAAAPETAMAIGELFPSDRFDAFSARYGADLRALDEVVVAGYAETNLALARGFVDPAKVERAFAARTIVDARHLEAGGVLHVEGRVGKTPERLLVLSARAAGIERGKAGPLKAAGLFAAERLKRARPALRADPLADAERALGGPWPARAFFPGPFDGEWIKGGGGLLRTATAAALGARPVAGPEPGGRIEIALIVLGQFEDGEGAKARLGAALDRLLSSDIGRLLGADHPSEALRVDVTSEQGLRARVVLRASPLFRGLHLATAASAEEIFQR